MYKLCEIDYIEISSVSLDQQIRTKTTFHERKAGYRSQLSQIPPEHRQITIQKFI